VVEREARYHRTDGPAKNSHPEGVPDPGNQTTSAVHDAARGEARPDSDLDFLVDFDRKTFDDYMGVKELLESLFSRRGGSRHEECVEASPPRSDPGRGRPCRVIHSSQIRRVGAHSPQPQADAPALFVGEQGDRPRRRAVTRMHDVGDSSRRPPLVRWAQRRSPCRLLGAL
jgi:hypothetical protein